MIVLDNKNQKIKQRSYRWWCGRKKRVKKKIYTFSQRIPITEKYEVIN